MTAWSQHIKSQLPLPEGHVELQTPQDEGTAPFVCLSAPPKKTLQFQKCFCVSSEGTTSVLHCHMPELSPWIFTAPWRAFLGFLSFSEGMNTRKIFRHISKVIHYVKHPPDRKSHYIYFSNAAKKTLILVINYLNADWLTPLCPPSADCSENHSLEITLTLSCSLLSKHGSGHRQTHMVLSFFVSPTKDLEKEK